MAAEIRAAWSKYTVGRVKRTSSMQRDRLIAAIEGPRAKIRALPPLSWAPAALHSELCTAIEGAIGPHLARRFWSDLILESMSTVLMRPVLAVALAASGGSPGPILNRSTRVWKLLTRDCAETSCVLEPEAATITYERLAPPLRTLAFMRSQVAACDATLLRAERRGSVELDDGKLARGTAILRIAWRST